MHFPRRLALSICTVAGGLFVSGTCVQAQQSPTCGWHFLDGRESPRTLERLLSRADVPSERHDEAVDNLRKWILDCDHTAARVAAMSLRGERRRTNSTDPFLRALLGLILVRGPDIHVLNAEGALIRPMNRHTNAEIEGVRLLTGVVEDTGWPEIVTELAAVAVITGKSESLQVAAESLRSLPDSVRDPEFRMALGEIELARGEYDAARDAVAAVAPTHARAARVLGMALMLDGETAAGADAYLEGLDAAAESHVVHRYFDDIRLLLGPEELAVWNALEEGHAEWIRRKWEWRALLSGVRVGERLAEHHRRLEHVLKSFRRVSYRGAPVPTTLWTDTMMPDPMLLDDRGMIYLRHGPPTEELRIIPIGDPPAQRIAWTYSRPGPVQPVFEFDRGPDRPDYFLAEPYPICGGRHVISRRQLYEGDTGISFGYPVPGDLMDWSMRLSQFDPSLAMFYSRCQTSPELAGNTFQTLLWEARRHGAELLNSENAAPRLMHPLTASMNLYSFRAAGATELAAYIAVHAGELTPSASRVPLAYAFRILFAAGDPVTESIARRDTVIAFTQPRPLPEGAVVGTAVPLRMRPADAAHVTLSVINGYDSQQGQVLATSRDVPAFPDSVLGISDIVIAEPRDGVWIRGSSRLAPAQGHAIIEGSAFRIYYELYNVAANDPLNVQVVVAPFDEEGLMERLRALIESRSALSIEFAEEAVPGRDGVVRTDRELAGELQPGSYVVTISVRNGRTGEVARRETNLVVVGG